ncbi:unnamed protein product [Jaminaea pallidilutea]
MVTWGRSSHGQGSLPGRAHGSSWVGVIWTRLGSEAAQRVKHMAPDARANSAGRERVESSACQSVLVFTALQRLQSLCHVWS